MRAASGPSGVDEQRRRLSGGSCAFASSATAMSQVCTDMFAQAHPQRSADEVAHRCRTCRRASRRAGRCRVRRNRVDQLDRLLRHRSRACSSALFAFHSVPDRLHDVGARRGSRPGPPQMSREEVAPVPMCDSTCAIDHSMSYDGPRQLVVGERLDERARAVCDARPCRCVQVEGTSSGRTRMLASGIDARRFELS